MLCNKPPFSSPSDLCIMLVPSVSQEFGQGTVEDGLSLCHGIRALAGNTGKLGWHNVWELEFSESSFSPVWYLDFEPSKMRTGYWRVFNGWVSLQHGSLEYSDFLYKSLGALSTRLPFFDLLSGNHRASLFLHSAVTRESKAHPHRRRGDTETTFQ